MNNSENFSIESEMAPAEESTLTEREQFFLGEAVSPTDSQDKVQIEVTSFISEFHTQPDVDGDGLTAELLLSSLNDRLTSELRTAVKGILTTAQTSSRALRDYYLAETYMQSELERYYRAPYAAHEYFILGDVHHPLANAMLNVQLDKAGARLQERATSDNRPEFLISKVVDQNTGQPGLWMADSTVPENPA